MRVNVESRNIGAGTLPAPTKLYLAMFSPAITDSSRKLYLESLATRRYAMHGVIRSAGSWINIGTQLPRFSRIMSCSTAARDGYAVNFYKQITSASKPAMQRLTYLRVHVCLEG